MTRRIGRNHRQLVADATEGRASLPEPLTEADQAMEQWLGRIPDDPGGLLREKLRRRYATQRFGPRRTLR